MQSKIKTQTKILNKLHKELTPKQFNLICQAIELEHHLTKESN